MYSLIINSVESRSIYIGGNIISINIMDYNFGR